MRLVEICSRFMWLFTKLVLLTPIAKLIGYCYSYQVKKKPQNSNFIAWFSPLIYPFWMYNFCS
jgi:hypothetical protein